MQAWLLALVILPARSNILMRFGLVAYLALLSFWVLPKEVWMVSSSFCFIKRLSYKGLTFRPQDPIYFLWPVMNYDVHVLGLFGHEVHEGILSCIGSLPCWGMIPLEPLCILFLLCYLD